MKMKCWLRGCPQDVAKWVGGRGGRGRGRGVEVGGDGLGVW